ncbi:ThuA domain-containing protein [Algoriphagus limi]|uniref:ThuA domain-containing protein n=1 Tax=Algoriphagus limi TaxID=2975273 RepID=A0ABT2G308_9BACT|nr:ThuA domain-containing protein [Algoriphagus limi]MCS5489650.1 ThuA domain-containing protein [Algoriphagus limi]
MRTFRINSLISFQIILGLSILFKFQNSYSQDLPEVPFDETWIQKIEEQAPSKTRFPFSKKKSVLVFSLHTGFEHWVIPHTEEIIKILGEKSGAFEVMGSKDISQFELENLKGFDAIVLNNTCSKPDHRNLFWDQLSNESDEDSVILMKKALQLERNLIDYVKSGGGLMVLHGGITTQNKSMEFSDLVGGSFDYHPPQQVIEVRVEDPKHPLTQAFSSGSFTHVDEPYFYMNAYEKKDFRPLLYFNNQEIKNQRKGQEKINGKTYAAWIRSEGKGKVFYAAPSHNAQSFENPKLLQFFLDGLQYLVGDVACDDSPIQTQ